MSASGELPDIWIRPGQAARILGVSCAWVAVLISRGELPSLKTPLGSLVDARAVEIMRAERERKAVSA